MRSINHLVIRGNLGGDPETFEAGSSKGVRLRVATNRSFKRQNGDQVKSTTWHPVTVWGDRALAMAVTLSKGDEVRIEGRVELREGQDQNGVSHVYYNVHGYEVELVTDPSRLPEEDEAQEASEPEEGYEA